MITRQMSNQILEAATQYPAVAVTGPRQSGKTTLCRELFPDSAGGGYHQRGRDPGNDREACK